MPHPNEPMSQYGARRAALLAGWDGIGPVPQGHSLPPEIDPALGHNGVPAPVPGDPDYTGE